MFWILPLAVLLLDVLLWRHLRKRLETAFPSRKRLPRWASVALFVVLFHPAVLMVVGGWSGSRALRELLPDGLLIAAMAVQVAALLYGAAVGVGGASRALWRVARGARIPLRRFAAALAPRADHHPTGGDTRPTAEVPDLERRRFVLASIVAAPSAALTLSAAGVVSARQMPVVTHLRVPVRPEWSELHGVTIAQLSDVHVGSYMDAARVDRLRDAVNALGADYHVITGDLLDNDVVQMELATRLLRGMRPRRGELFFAMGNHEYIAARRADVRGIVRGLEEAGAQVLIDEARRVRVGAHHLWMGAIDYPPSRHSRYQRWSDRSTEESLALALADMRDDGAPRILLSHHPRTFVAARELPLDLMLSGHTHGGQIHLGRVGDYALSPVLPIDFYHKGTYRHGNRQLYVNSGTGGWLPVRINCPPEITLVHLVAEAPARCRSLV